MITIMMNGMPIRMMMNEARRYLLLLDVRCGGGLAVKVLTPEIILASTHHRFGQLIFLLQAINISVVQRFIFSYLLKISCKGSVTLNMFQYKT